MCKINNEVVWVQKHEHESSKCFIEQFKFIGSVNFVLKRIITFEACKVIFRLNMLWKERGGKEVCYDWFGYCTWKKLVKASREIFFFKFLAQNFTSITSWWPWLSCLSYSLSPVAEWKRTLGFKLLHYTNIIKVSTNFSILQSHFCCGLFFYHESLKNVLHSFQNW